MSSRLCMILRTKFGKGIAINYFVQLRETLITLLLPNQQKSASKHYRVCGLRHWLPQTRLVALSLHQSAGLFI